VLHHALDLTAGRVDAQERCTIWKH